MLSFNTREEFLLVAVEKLRPIFNFDLGRDIPNVRISCGFSFGARAYPKKNGGFSIPRPLAQTWLPHTTMDGIPQIFISPEIAEVGGTHGLLSVLTHELIHVLCNSNHYHHRTFAKLAEKLGFERPWGIPTAGVNLQERFKGIAEELGPYPHSPIIVMRCSTNRKLYAIFTARCKKCEYKVNVGTKQLRLGLPHCPLHGEMKI